MSIDLERIRNQFQPDPTIYQALIHSPKARPEILLIGEYHSSDLDFLLSVCSKLHLHDMNCNYLNAKKSGITLYNSFDKLPPGLKFDIVYINRYFNSKEINVVKELDFIWELTANDGIHVLQHVLDYGHKTDQTYPIYLPSKYLSNYYKSWNMLTDFEGVVPNSEKRQSIIIARKLNQERVPRQGQLFSLKIVLLIVAMLLVATNISPIHLSFEAKWLKQVLWPVYLINICLSIAFGFWGLLVSIIQAATVSCMLYGFNKTVLISTLANFAQYLTVCVAYRGLLKNSYWSNRNLSFKVFFAYANILPLVLGSLIGGYAFMREPSLMGYMKSSLKWFISGFPLCLIGGWPLFRQLIGILNREGLTIRGWFSRY
ncbi:MAG: hypothetical protein AB8G05_27915 [Oligoflexales bacterium]